MPNDSTTGGPLVPIPGSPAPLVGQALNRFFQTFIVGLTGLDGTMVRPRWQVEPSNIPEAGIVWASIGVLKRGPGDSYPQVVQIDDNTSEVSRNEELTVLCSFYDDGSSGQADYYSELLRDGLSVQQNREILQINEMNIISTPENSVAVPSLLKQLWQYRVDVEIAIRRRIRRRYPVKSLLIAQVEQNTYGDNEIADHWSVP